MIYMNYHECPGEGWTWYSICSKHMMNSQEDCALCMSGSWSNDEEHTVDSILYDTDYPAWYKKHNATDSKARKILTTIFPNLKLSTQSEDNTQ